MRAKAGEWTYKFRDWEPAKKLYLENPSPLEETLKFDNGESVTFEKIGNQEYMGQWMNKHEDNKFEVTRPNGKKFMTKI